MYPIVSTCESEYAVLVFVHLCRKFCVYCTRLNCPNLKDRHPYFDYRGYTGDGTQPYCCDNTVVARNMPVQAVALGKSGTAVKLTLGDFQNIKNMLFFPVIFYFRRALASIISCLYRRYFGRYFSPNFPPSSPLSLPRCDDVHTTWLLGPSQL